MKLTTSHACCAAVAGDVTVFAAGDINILNASGGRVAGSSVTLVALGDTAGSTGAITDSPGAPNNAIEAISTADVLSQMDTAGNALNLVILDACRNNPFKGRLRSASRGLARIHAASGSLVAFAAAPGQAAEDGDGENSPYTKALVEAMHVPGLAVEQVFKRVRISVEEQTGRQQTPWEESSLRGDFYFVPLKSGQRPTSRRSW